MEPRTIAIGLIAVVAAFGAAFGISSAGGEKTATAGPGTKAESIKAPSTAAVSGIEVGGTVPALKAEKKKKPAKKESSSDSSPSTSNATTQPETQSQPETTNTTPQNTTPAPQNNTPAPQNNTPSKPKPQNDGPVSGGGEDG